MKKFIENTTNSPQYYSGVMVPPGEGVLVDVADDAQPEEPGLPAATLAELAAEELKLPLKHLVDNVGDASDDALDMMQALEEQAKKPRQALLAAFAGEKIKRANAALKSDAL